MPQFFDLVGHEFRMSIRRPGLWVAYAGTSGDYTMAISGQGLTWVTVYVPPR